MVSCALLSTQQVEDQQFSHRTLCRYLVHVEFFFAGKGEALDEPVNAVGENSRPRQPSR